MVLDRPEFRQLEDFGRNDFTYERHHAEVGREVAEYRLAGRLFQPRRFQGRYTSGIGGRPETVGPPAQRLGRRRDGNDFFARFSELQKYVLAERRLADYNDPQVSLPN